MKAISYILLIIALGLGVIGLVLFLKSESDKRDSVLSSLQKAREAKAAKKKLDHFDEPEKEIEHEINEILNKHDNASTKEETE